MRTIEVGHDVRHWTTYEVKDAAPGEVEELYDLPEFDQANILRALDDAGRLVWVSDDHDDNPDAFGDHASPAITNYNDGE